VLLAGTTLRVGWIWTAFPRSVQRHDHAGLDRPVRREPPPRSGRRLCTFASRSKDPGAARTRCAAARCSRRGVGRLSLRNGSWSPPGRLGAYRRADRRPAVHLRAHGRLAPGPDPGQDRMPAPRRLARLALSAGLVLPRSRWRRLVPGGRPCSCWPTCAKAIHSPNWPRARRARPNDTDFYPVTIIVGSGWGSLTGFRFGQLRSERR
jgi:hypothetical protein